MAAANPRTPEYTVTTAYNGGWLVLGRQSFVKQCATFNEAHALAATMNKAHADVVQLADALVAQHLTPRQP